MKASEDGSAEFLRQEMEATQKALEETLRLQEETQKPRHPQQVDASAKEPPVVQLSKLQQTTDSLVLAQEIAEWMAQAPQEGENEDSTLLAEAAWCERLAQNVILQHPDLLELGAAAIYEETYLPLYDYVYQSLLARLRQQLVAVQYPKGCSQLLKQCSLGESSLFGQTCRWLFQLEICHQDVLQAIEQQPTEQLQAPSMVLVRELLRPIVERVSFHFVEQSEDRITTTRVDRLPEWLLSYIRDHVLEGADEGVPYQLVNVGLPQLLSVEDATQLNLCFLTELVGLVEWVLVQRQFFRQPEIAGPKSNPMLLYNAMEQFLLFDRTLRESTPGLMGLMDVLVMADEEVRQWWIDRDRETVLTTLFEDDSMAHIPKPLANHVSPRAETFCALIRSIQWKASTLTAPGLYLRQVAVPLCSQFVDAIHETSTDLRNLIGQTSRGRNGLLSSGQLVANLHEWIELINGTHLASTVLLREGSWQDGMPTTSQSDHDLARFGRSLQRLVEVMIEEFSASFVETVLMERAKFASYLMLASHLLASQEWDYDDRDLSVELKETRTVLTQFKQVCNSILSAAAEESKTEEPTPDEEIAQFAPRGIRHHVVSRVADKFLEVALDVQDMTPDLWQNGVVVFARDVEAILGEYKDLPLVQRLVDVTEFLTMDHGSVQALMAALGGLVGASDFLDINDFSADGTLFEEAVNMIKAKGFNSLELSDAISILNRRRD